jgi:hypothetical protein
MAVEEWGCDVPVSAPEVPQRYIAVSFGGFAFTTQGMTHDITEGDREDLLTPYFAPEHFIPRNP